MNTIKLLMGATALIVTSVSHAGLISFTSSSTFEVPDLITEIRVLTIGGGGGGANGHQGGGGAGYLSTGIFSVNNGDLFSITVGDGGVGANSSGGNDIVGLSAGGFSSFDSLLSSLGGGVVTGINQGGHNGSSGGGAACNSGSIGGSGGSGGTNGQGCQSGFSMPIGLGSGDYSSLLDIFTQADITAGLGGLGGTGTHAGGGGAGGILIDGFGIFAGSGIADFSGIGGHGYGAGGGAGGLDFNISSTRFGGGDGASGLVYVEWDDVEITSVPEPSVIALIGVGLIGLGFVRRRRKR